MVSHALLLELQEIIRKEYGRDLSMDKVATIGNGLVDYFGALQDGYQKLTINNNLYDAH